MAQELPVPYLAKEVAPQTEAELFNCTSLVVWDGASENLIWTHPEVNYKFRAIHDYAHLETRLDFSPLHEIELGRIQANLYARRCQLLLADVTYIEIAEQAKHFLKTGQFVKDQLRFTLEHLC
jgi:hypothetical protein